MKTPLPIVLAIAVVLPLSVPAQEEPGATRLVDLSKPQSFEISVQSGATAEVGPGKDGEAIKVRIPTGKGYPGVQIAPAKGAAGSAAWDLSRHAYIVARVHNPTHHGMKLELRADNEGDWKQSPWNTQPAPLPAGDTQDLMLWFGYSYGKKAFNLDPAKVIRVLLFVGHPKQDLEFEVQGVWAGGKVGDMPPFAKETLNLRPENDLVFDASKGLTALSAQGEDATVELVERGGAKQLAVTVAGGAKSKLPGAVLRPKDFASWNLNQCNYVDFHLANPGTEPVNIHCRVDNNGAVRNRKSAQAEATLAAGKSAVVRVSFLQPPVNIADKRVTQGLLDSSHVVAVRVFTDAADTTRVFQLEKVQGGAAKVSSGGLGEQPPVPGKWTQTLDENFDGDTLDEQIWTPRMSWDGPIKRRPNRYSTKNVFVKDGKFIILCEKKHGHQYDNPELETREYTTGTATTLGKWIQRYGYFEAKVKLPKARGLWPAFWMMPDRGTDSGLDLWQRRSTGTIDGHGQGMEVDIMEHLSRFGPNFYNIACHWDGYGKDHKSVGASSLYVQPTEDDWLISGLLWEPGKMTWFCNGREIGHWEDERISNVSHFLKLTVDMGGWGGNDVVDADLPDTFEVDYIRAWQRDDLKD